MMQLRRYGLFFIVAFFFANSVWAVSPGPQVEMEFFPDREKQTVEVKFIVSNESLESIERLSVSFGTQHKPLTIMEQLGPGQSQRIKREYTFDDFGLLLPGTYEIPYFLSYARADKVVVSYQRIATLKFPPLSARALEIQFDHIDPGSLLRIDDEVDVAVTVRSIAAYHLGVISLKPSFPDGVLSTMEGAQLPLPLAPGETFKAIFHFKRGEVIPEHVYDGWVIVRGEAIGRHFSESLPISIEFLPKAKGLLFLYILVFVIVTCVVILVGRIYWRRQARTAYAGGGPSLNTSQQRNRMKGLIGRR